MALTGSPRTPRVPTSAARRRRAGTATPKATTPQPTSGTRIEAGPAQDPVTFVAIGTLEWTLHTWSGGRCATTGDAIAVAPTATFDVVGEGRDMVTDHLGQSWRPTARVGDDAFRAGSFVSPHRGSHRRVRARDEVDEWIRRRDPAAAGTTVRAST